MKKFFSKLFMLVILVLSTTTKTNAQAVNPSTLNPFKKDGVGKKVALETFTNAVVDATAGNYTKWNAIVRCPFDVYVSLVRDNVAAYKADVTSSEIRYMLINAKLVARRVHRGEKIWGMLSGSNYGYYTIDHDFDAAILTYEDKTASGYTQIDMAIWDCFNPKEVHHTEGVTCSSKTDTVLIKEIVYVDRDVPGPMRTEIRTETKVVSYPRDQYYTSYNNNWYPTPQPSYYSPGYYMMPMTLCSQMNIQPSYMCVSNGVKCGMVPATTQNNVTINNYITNNSTTIVNNTIQLVHPEKPRPEPIYHITGGAGDGATVSGAGGEHPTTTGGVPTGGTGTNSNPTAAGGEYPSPSNGTVTGGAPTGANVSGGAGKTDGWNQVSPTDFRRPAPVASRIMNPSSPAVNGFEAYRQDNPRIIIDNRPQGIITTTTNNNGFDQPRSQNTNPGVNTRPVYANTSNPSVNNTRPITTTTQEYTSTANNNRPVGGYVNTTNNYVQEQPRYTNIGGAQNDVQRNYGGTQFNQQQPVMQSQGQGGNTPRPMQVQGRR